MSIRSRQHARPACEGTPRDGQLPYGDLPGLGPYRFEAIYNTIPLVDLYARAVC